MKIERLMNVKLAAAIDATMRSRADIAHALGIAPQTLSALINGRMAVSEKNRQRLSELLGRPESELFD